jgi:hypothetical protein
MERATKDFNYAFAIQGLCGLIALAFAIFS